MAVTCVTLFKVVDDKTYFEIMPDWAKNITVGFARMEGHPVGIVANNPMFLAGCLDIDTSTKASKRLPTPLLGRRLVLVRKSFPPPPPSRKEDDGESFVAFFLFFRFAVS